MPTLATYTSLLSCVLYVDDVRGVYVVAKHVANLLHSRDTGCPAVLRRDYVTESTSLVTVQCVSHTDNLIHVWSLLLDAVFLVQEVEGTSSLSTWQNSDTI